MITPIALVLGPADPLAPLADEETVIAHPTGARVVRQRYEDGDLYQLEVRKGERAAICIALLGHVPEGAWVDMFSPWGSVGEDGQLRLAIWVRRNESVIG